MIAALICSEESGIPAGCASSIRAAGVDLRCRNCRDEADLVAFAAPAQVLWYFGPNRFLDRRTLERLPNCKAIFRSGSGLDSIPECASEIGLRICNTPESIAESVAEHAVGLLFALIRHVPQFDSQVRRGIWETDPVSQTRWHASRRCLGLVGYGRIARHVEEMVRGFHMEVCHFDPYVPGSLSLEQVLRKADFVSLHCPLTPETRHLIGARELAMLKPGALLVNTSRGEVLDEKALAEALREGRLGGAALDVLAQEPPDPGNPLLKLDNVILTPHVAALSADFERNFWDCSAARIIALARELDA